MSDTNITQPEETTKVDNYVTFKEFAENISAGEIRFKTSNSFYYHIKQVDPSKLNLSVETITLDDGTKVQAGDGNGFDLGSITHSVSVYDNLGNCIIEDRYISTLNNSFEEAMEAVGLELTDKVAMWETLPVFTPPEKDDTIPDPSLTFPREEENLSEEDDK